MRSLQRPSGNDPVAVAHLVDDIDPQVGEQRAIQRDGSRDALVPTELERVDVVDEIGCVQLPGALQIAAGTDPSSAARACVD